MSNYFWAANGKFEKINIIEHMSTFSVDDDKLCIQDTCLTKEEIIMLKESVADYKIFDNVNKKDYLTTKEVKQYVKEIFRIIYVSKDEGSNNLNYLSNINKYLNYGLNDSKTNNDVNLNTEYGNYDFVKLNAKMDDVNQINEYKWDENFVSGVMERNRIDFPDDKRKRFVILDSGVDILSINPVYYYFTIDNVGYALIKPTSSENVSYWKLLVLDDNIVNKITKDFDDKFAIEYESQIKLINEINGKAELTRVEYLSLLEKLKEISIKDGEFYFDSYKDKLFIKYYRTPFENELDIIDEPYFKDNIEFGVNFRKSVISNENKLNELKIRLGVDAVKPTHYILEQTETIDMRLLSVKYKDRNDYQWQILFLYNDKFIDYDEGSESEITTTSNESLESFGNLNKYTLNFNNLNIIVNKN